MLEKKCYCISLQKYSSHMVSICTIYKSHYLMVVFPNHHKTDFIPQNDTTSWNRSGTSKLLHKSLPEYSNSLNSPILTKKSYVRAIFALYRPPLTSFIRNTLQGFTARYMSYSCLIKPQLQLDPPTRGNIKRHYISISLLWYLSSKCKCVVL